jgi:hypothetical protein
MRVAKLHVGEHPLRVKPEAIKHFASLPQFHGIPDADLIRLAQRRTKLHVPDRWVAIALILGNHIPIPVPGSNWRPRWQPEEPTIPAKLEAIQGGRIVR